MHEAVTLLVPIDERYRAIVPDIARKYVEIAGGSPSDVESIVDRLHGAIAQLTTAAAGESQIALVFQVDQGSVEFVVQCGGQSLTVTQPLPARKLS
jgi:hypothetical protein